MEGGRCIDEALVWREIRRPGDPSIRFEACVVTSNGRVGIADFKYQPPRRMDHLHPYTATPWKLLDASRRVHRRWGSIRRRVGKVTPRDYRHGAGSGQKTSNQRTTGISEGIARIIEKKTRLILNKPAVWRPQVKNVAEALLEVRCLTERPGGGCRWGEEDICGIGGGGADASLREGPRC